MWASILSDVDNESARAVDEALLTHSIPIVHQRALNFGDKGTMIFIRKDAQITI